MKLAFRRPIQSWEQWYQQVSHFYLQGTNNFRIFTLFPCQKFGLQYSGHLFSRLACFEQHMTKQPRFPSIWGRDTETWEHDIMVTMSDIALVSGVGILSNGFVGDNTWLLPSEWYSVSPAEENTRPKFNLGWFSTQGVHLSFWPWSEHDILVPSSQCWSSCYLTRAHGHLITRFTSWVLAFSSSRALLTMYKVLDKVRTVEASVFHVLRFLPAKNFDCDIVDTCFHASPVSVKTRPNRLPFLLYEGNSERTTIADSSE